MPVSSVKFLKSSSIEKVFFAVSVRNFEWNFILKHDSQRDLTQRGIYSCTLAPKQIRRPQKSMGIFFQGQKLKIISGKKFGRRGVIK